MVSPDDSVFVPISTYRERPLRQRPPSTVSIQVASEDVSASVQAQVERSVAALGQLRDDQDLDFEVRSQTEMLETMNQVTGIVTALLGSVAAVSSSWASVP